MKTIFKYPLTTITTLDLPRESQVVSFQIQDRTPTIWVLQETNNEKISRTFFIVGTGWEITQENFEYIGTAQDGYFVWHLFEQLYDRGFNIQRNG